MALSKEQILSANDLPCDEVPVPEWGGDVRLKMLSGEQRQIIEDLSQKPENSKRVKHLLLSYAIVDDADSPQFGEKETGALFKKNGTVLDRLLVHILKQNAFKDDEIEELEKN